MIFDNDKDKYVEEGQHEVCRRLKDLDGSIYHHGFEYQSQSPKYKVYKFLRFIVRVDKSPFKVRFKFI